MTTTRKQPDAVERAYRHYILSLPVGHRGGKSLDDWRAAVEVERERCAKVVEDFHCDCDEHWCLCLDRAAATIRNG